MYIRTRRFPSTFHLPRKQRAADSVGRPSCFQSFSLFHLNTHAGQYMRRWFKTLV